MWAKKNQTGFTIVETLIVLGITVVMFLSTATLVSGQIAKNQFRQGMNQIKDSIIDKINDVQSGYYPGVVKTNLSSCAFDPSGVNAGENTSCQLLGKYIYFGPNSILVDPWVSKAPLPPFQLTSSRETITYPSEIHKSTGGQFLIVSTKTNGNGLVSSGTGSPAPMLLCFDNAATIKITFGGKPDVTLEYGPCV